jgi:RecA/RadA recombinase
MSKNKEQDNGEATKGTLDALLNKYKDDHFNFIENHPVKVSTGSLNLDQEIVLTEGIHRFVGYSGAGKSSEALLIMKNFLDIKNEKRKAILVKAEGRLSDNIKARSGVKFCFDAKQWNYGTCFVLESNLMEFICETLETIVKQSYTEGERLLVVIDSVDGLRLKADEKKGFGEEKVAGAPGLMKRFLSKMSLPLQKYGVVCICLSQVSSNIKIDPYSKEAPKMTSGGGGWALVHFANYILEFEARYNGDNILEDPKAKYDPEKNKIVGHWATVTIKKSDKENEFTKVKYPIKHGRLGGNSIWIEYEIIDILLGWSLLKKAGAWLNFSPTLIEEAKSSGITIEPQHQGIDNLRKYLEDNQNITEYLFNRFKEVLGK